MTAGSRSRVQVKIQVLGNNSEYWGVPNMCGLVYDSAVSKAGNLAVESQVDRSCFPPTITQSPNAFVPPDI